VSAMLHYAVSLKNQEVGKQVYSFIEAVLTDKKEIIMTYGEQLVQQGMQTRNLEIARTMLHNLHLGVDAVEQAAGLSKQDLASL
ncbi:MAG: hypothetical protein AAF400_01265, partial [Bacteroidota bacterium]